MEDKGKRRTLHVFLAYGNGSLDINHFYGHDELSARRELNDWLVDQTLLGRTELLVLPAPAGCNVDGVTFWPGYPEGEARQ